MWYLYLSETPLSHLETACRLTLSASATNYRATFLTDSCPARKIDPGGAALAIFMRFRR